MSLHNFQDDNIWQILGLAFKDVHHLVCAYDPINYSPSEGSKLY